MKFTETTVYDHEHDNTPKGAKREVMELRTLLTICGVTLAMLGTFTYLILKGII